jgi:hypothetical protein
MRRAEILSVMRIAVAIFGFLSLVATLFVALPVKFSSEAVSPEQVQAEPESHFLTEVLASFFPKGDRLAPARSVEEVEAAIAEEIAARREPEGPPLAPPDVPMETLCQMLASEAQANGLPAGFFARLIWQESKYNQRIVSHAGAQGVAQFMPTVAAERGLLNPFDALSALPHSARFLREHVQNFGNLGLAAAAYNAGSRRVTEWLARRGKLPDETRQYVKIITGHEPERWTQTDEIDMPVALPRQNPCEGVAELSRSAEPTKIAVQLEPPVARIIEAARIAAAKAASDAKARKLASLKSKRGKLLAKLRGGKNKTKDKGEVVAQKAADKPGDRSKGKADRLAAKSSSKSSSKPATKIADRVTDKPKGRVRVADSSSRR